MTAFYNEHDPYAAQWLRNLIVAGYIASGIVDERNIQDIEPWELMNFTQVHMFAGIGVWSGALRTAGWPDNKPIWTGSCPCQPFSNAGQRKGFSDERHLWPVWRDLIAQCKPPIVVGEQVASKDGRIRLDTVSSEMEALGFAFGAADLCAAGFGGAHIRQRNYFVGLAHHHHHLGLQGWAGMPECVLELPTGPRSVDGGLVQSDSTGRVTREQGAQGTRHWDSTIAASRSGGNSIRHPGQTRSLDDADWLLCRNPAGEPSWRPVESGTFPLAHGVASRMGKLRTYGNALDFGTAKGFCEVVTEISQGI